MTGLNKSLDSGGQVDGTFILDFEKAFDTSPHELLKFKLRAYDTWNNFIMDWFISVQ